MSADLKVSVRYAQSFLESSIEKKNLDASAKDMELVASTMEANPQLKSALESPIIKSELKISIIEEIFKDKISKDSLSFLLFIIKKGREDILFKIVKKFLELNDEHLGIVNVEIKTAFKFSDDQKEELKKKFESQLNKIIRFKFLIDHDVVGGFVARVGDTVFDASVKHQLELLKKQFVQGSASLN